MAALLVIVIANMAPWPETEFRIAPDLSEGVERIPDDEAAAYYDGRKLVNDNQRNYIDSLAKEKSE